MLKQNGEHKIQQRCNIEGAELNLSYNNKSYKDVV